MAYDFLINHNQAMIPQRQFYIMSNKIYYNLNYNYREIHIYTCLKQNCESKWKTGIALQPEFIGNFKRI